MKHTAQWEAAMQRQPKDPNDTQPFVCMTCFEDFSAGRPGFVTRDGLPKHVQCEEVGELEEYKNANNGHGYHLDFTLFPGWKIEVQP